MVSLRQVTRGIETSKYPQEEKAIAIPSVAASEMGTGQTESAHESEWRCGVWTAVITRPLLAEVHWNVAPKSVKVAYVKAERVRACSRVWAV